MPHDGFPNGVDVFRRRTTTTTDYIYEAGVGELGQNLSHVLRCVVVFSEFIGQTGVRVDAGIYLGDPGHLFYVGSKIVGTERTIETGYQWASVPNRVPERFCCLA